MAAVTTEVQIWNIALSRVGERAVSSVSDTSAAAGHCQTHYDFCLKEVLERFEWPFARRQAILSEPDGVEREGWEYCYLLPSDCVKPLRLLAEDERAGLLTPYTRTPYAVMPAINADDSIDGMLLCTDAESGEDFEVLEYIALVEYIPSYPSIFVSALAWRLASELALSVSKKRDVSTACLQMFEIVLSQAKAYANNSETVDPEPDPPSVAARS